MHFHLATLLALPALSLAALFSENIGCYSQILSIQSVAKFDYQSREWCLDYCDTNNATYAALNFGSKCSCTNTLPRDAAKVDDDKCDVACRGWPEDTCQFISEADPPENSPTLISILQAAVAVTGPS